MTQISESVSHLIDQLSRLPGIGRKSAERLAYHLLRVHESEAMELATAIQGMRANVHYCEVCFNLAEQDKCQVCLDSRRDSSLLCVVEQPRDVISLEQAAVYNGLYHVLLGRIAPLEGMGPEDLMIESLVDRVREGTFTEIILAMFCRCDDIKKGPVSIKHTRINIVQSSHFLDVPYKYWGLSQITSPYCL